MDLSRRAPETPHHTGLGRRKAVNIPNVPRVRSPILWAAVGSVGAIAMGVQVRFAWWMLVAAALSLLLAFLSLRWKRGMWPALLFCALLCSFCWGSLRVTVPVLPPEGQARVRGRVVTEPVVKGESLTFFLEAVTVDAGAGSVRLPGRLWLRCVRGEQGGGKAPKVGQIVETDATLSRPQGQRNPGGFDFRAYLQRQGAHMAAYAYRGWETSGAPAQGIGAAIQAGRSALAERMDTLYGEQSPAIRGMIIGDRQDLGEEEQRAFRRSGISHLLSVSGLHVAFVAMPLLWLARKLALRGWQKLLLIAALLAGYCLLVGAPPSTIRACVMVLMVQGAPVAGRRYDSLTALAAVFWAMLLINPLSLWDSSLTLSCAAVLGIVLLYPLCKKMFARLPKGLCATLSVSLAAQLGTLPLGAVYFHELPLLGMLANLAAVPASSVVVVLGFAAIPLDALWPPLAYPLVCAVRAAAWVIAQTSLWTAAIPFAVVRMASPPWYTVAACYVAIAFIGGAWWAHGKASLRWGVAGVAVAAALGTSALLSWQGMQYVQLDVGQGDAAVVRAGGYTAVIDTGSQGTGALVDYLRHEALTVDALFISHPHEDHAGALQDLMAEEIPIRRILLPGDLRAEQIDPPVYKGLVAAQNRGIPIEGLKAGQTLTLSPLLQVEVLGPAAGNAATDVNDISLVMMLDIGGTRVLTTGDITEVAEPLEGIACDVLKVAHHGSKYSSSRRFLAVSQPEFAVIGVGRNNYGHPAPELLDKLYEVGAQVMRTDAGGALMLRLDEHGIKARTYLQHEE